MRRGRLNRIVTIERREVIGTVGYGEPLYGWVVKHRCWAERFSETETEVGTESQIIAKTTAKFRMDYLVGVQPTDRLTCEGETFDILGVIEIGYRRTTEITAERIE